MECTILLQDTFRDSRSRLTETEQKKVEAKLSLLLKNPAHPGLKLHKVNKSKDQRFRSIRVNHILRIIIHCVRSTWRLCYVGHHNEAYRWAERRWLGEDPNTGAAQFMYMERRPPEHRDSPGSTEELADIDGDGRSHLDAHAVFAHPSSQYGAMGSVDQEPTNADLLADLPADQVLDNENPESRASTDQNISVVPIRTGGDADARLRLAKRLVDEAEYAWALRELEIASDSSPTDSQEAEIALQRGRIFMLTHDDRCETQLLRADSAYARIYGEDSAQRLPPVQLLLRWYDRSGESNRVLTYAGIAASLIGQNPATSLLERFLTDYKTADCLQDSGRFREALGVLDHAMLSIVLHKNRHPGTRPDARYVLSTEEIKSCGIPSRHLARHFLLAGKILRHLGRIEAALEELETAGTLAQRCTSAPELEANVMLEKGIVFRKRGLTKEALEFYSRARELNERNGSPSLTTRYRINQSEGVAYANCNETKLAMEAYSRAREDAELLYGPDHTELASLLQSQAKLALREGEFEQCIEFAGRAVEILKLKAPERYQDIGVALLRLGKAHNALGQYESGAAILYEAQENFERSDPGPSANVWKDLHEAQRIAQAPATVAINDPRCLSRLAGYDNSDSRPTGGLEQERLMLACRQFLRPRSSEQIHRAFAIACEGGVDHSIEEFDAAESEVQIDAVTYRDYALVMFIHGKVGLAYSYLKEAVSADQDIEIPPMLRTILETYPSCFDNSGMPRKESIETFASLRREYIHTISAQQPPTL